MAISTLNKITTDLLNIVRNSNISDSENISKRQLEDWVHQYRSIVLKQDLDKGKRPNPDYIQEIDHLKLSAIDTAGSNITVNGIPTGNYILISDLEIPNTLDLNFKSGFMYVGTVDGTEISFMPEGRAKWQQYKKYTADDAVCFLRGGYLYVMYNKPLEYITIRGIFENPVEVGRFVNPMTSQPYFNDNSHYPIPANMLPLIKSMILQKELGMEVKTFSDDTDDSSNKQTPNINSQQS